MWHSLNIKGADSDLQAQLRQALKDLQGAPGIETQQFIPAFKAEGCAVYIGDYKITSNLHLTLMERWHEDEAKNYLQQRHNITTAIFDTVYWQSMRFAFALKKLSPHRRATAIKAIHHHLPTQEKLFKQGQVVSAPHVHGVYRPRKPMHMFFVVLIWNQ